MLRQRADSLLSWAEQGNLLKGIDNWSGAAQFVVQGPNSPFDNTFPASDSEPYISGA